MVLIPPVAAPEITEDKAEVSSDIVWPRPLGRLVRLIVRNSVACCHCGEVVACTQMSPKTWVEHICDDTQFAIRGGTEATERSGSNVDYTESTRYENVIAVGHIHNPTGQGYFPPVKEEAV